MNVLRSAAVQWIVGIALGAVFLYAAYPKVHEPREFARIVYHYRLVGPNARIPPAVANTFAVTLPWIEAVTGLLLVIGVWRREAAVLCALLLVMFLLAVGWALAHGIDIENCGCFTMHGEGRKAGLKLLLEDTLMLAGALVLTLGPPPPERSASR